MASPSVTRGSAPGEPAAMAEVMASVTTDPAVGRVMMLAVGGVQAELWSDQVLIAAPFTQAEIARALARLKTSALIDGYRGRPAGDRAALITALLALACVDGDVEVNPILVHEQGVTAVDAVMRLP